MRRVLSLFAILAGLTSAAWAIGWEAETLSTPIEYRNNERGSFDLLRDTSGNTHLVFGGNALYYKVFDGTIWSAPEEIDRPAGTSYSVGYDLVRITMDGNSRLHVLHNRGDELRYTTNASGEWKTLLLDTGTLGVSDIVTDASGFIHFFYTNGSGTWLVSDSSGSLDKEKVSDETILDFDHTFKVRVESGEPELFYCQYSSSLARLGKWDMDEWATRTYLYKECEDFDLAVDTEGLWHLALGKNSQVPRYAYEKDPEQWEDEDINLLLGEDIDHAPISKEGKVNILLGSSDKAYISLVDRWDDDNLTLLSRNVNEFEPMESNWSLTTLPYRYVEPWHRMIMGASGPELYFTDVDDALRRYRASDGTGTVIATKSGFGSELSLRVDTGGNLHAAWMKGDRLYYGTDSSGSWSESIVTEALSYTSPDLEVSGNGQVFIAYRNPDYALSVIHSTDTNWSIDTGFNDACGHGLALERNSSGIVHVACAQNGTVLLGHFDEQSDTWSDPGETVGSYSGTVDALDLAFYDSSPFVLVRIDTSDSDDNKELYLLHRENGTWEGNTSFREYSGNAAGGILVSGPGGLHLLYGIPAKSFEEYHAEGESNDYGMMEYGSWNPASKSVTTEAFPDADTPAIIKSAATDDDGNLFVIARTGIITDGKFANYQNSFLTRRNGTWMRQARSGYYSTESNLQHYGNTLYRIARNYYRNEFILYNRDTDMSFLAKTSDLTRQYAAYGRTANEQTADFVNTSEIALSLGSATLSGSEAFSISSDGCVGSLPAGESCSVGVLFAPSSGTYHSALLSVTPEGGMTESVRLTGYAIALADPLTPAETGSGDGGDDDEGCFIATAAYGTPMHADIDVLRHFRDRVLMQNGAGQWLVKEYYALSPSIADWIRKASWRQAATRGVLKPIIWGVTHPWTTLAGALGLFGAIWWMRRRRTAR